MTINTSIIEREHPMKFACLLKRRRDLNEVISGLNDYQQPAQWYQTKPGRILPIVQVTQITSSFPLPTWGVSSHTPGKAIGVLSKTAAWNKLLPRKSPTDYIFVSQQKSPEKGPG